jgi:putative addiction module killer protein
MRYAIEEYITAGGRRPFGEWLLGLRDDVAKAKLLARIDRAAQGNFGDWKALSGAKGIFEMRESYGPGYRVYYAIIRRSIILLLAGSTKKDQDRTIARAKAFLVDYERRLMS